LGKKKKGPCGGRCKLRQHHKGEEKGPRVLKGTGEKKLGRKLGKYGTTKGTLGSDGRRD